MLPEVPGPGTSGNITYGYGGGIWVGFSSDPIITSNIITGNRAGDPNTDYSVGSGGGIVVFPGDASRPGPLIDRNLIADNVTDSLGGGIGLNSLQNTGARAGVTNNIIEGNRLEQFGTGGGIYTLDLSATFDPDIRNNDLWNNDRNQIAGDRTDAGTIGTNGNFSADPRFINR